MKSLIFLWFGGVSVGQYRGMPQNYCIRCGSLVHSGEF